MKKLSKSEVNIIIAIITMIRAYAAHNNAYDARNRYEVML
jgi:hypothetical protein